MSVPRLMAISALEALPDGGLDAWLEALAAAGVDAFQLRAKELTDLALYRLALRARRRLAGRTALLINGRPDIARAAGADGVHLPARGLPVDAVRRIVGEEARVGRSCHSLAEVESALREGADYALLSPIFETPGKGPPLGVETLARAAAIGLPVLALGGATIERLAAVAAAGAQGAAGIRLFLDRECLPQLTRQAAELF